jgi:hypothetical protein
VVQLYPQAPGIHFSRLLRHAWVTVGLFLFPGHHMEGTLPLYRPMCKHSNKSFELHERRWISSLAESLSASQEELCSMNPVICLTSLLRRLRSYVQLISASVKILGQFNLLTSHIRTQWLRPFLLGDWMFWERERRVSFRTKKAEQSAVVAGRLKTSTYWAQRTQFGKTQRKPRWNVWSTSTLCHIGELCQFVRLIEANMILNLISSRNNVICIHM